MIGLGRNPARCDQAKKDLLAVATDAHQVEMLCADLALLADTERAANDIAALTDRVDVLLNNAGGITRELQITAEGNENIFASNHLGHFLLTKRLLPLLRSAARTSSNSPVATTRVINVSSSAHNNCNGLDWNDLQMMENFDPTTAYRRVKLANILFTRELARQLAADNIVVHAMHPGIVDSNFVSHADQAMQDYFRSKSDALASPDTAADTLVWLACSKEPGKSTGRYFYQRAAIETSAAGRDDAAAKKLWQESEKLLSSSPR